MAAKEQNKILIMKSLIGLNTVLWFGKYKERLVSAVIREDYNYIKWCTENIPDFIPNEALRKEIIKEENIENSKS